MLIFQSFLVAVSFPDSILLRSSINIHSHFDFAVVLDLSNFLLIVRIIYFLLLVCYIYLSYTLHLTFRSVLRKTKPEASLIGRYQNY